MKIKNLLFTALFTASFLSVQAQNTLTEIWATEGTIPVPESVFYSEGDKILYVAQIDGKSGEKDGKGAIGKVGLDGKVIDLNWVSGLNAPKGMGKLGSKFYVADVTDIVEIDFKSGKILQKYPVEGSKFLNDLTTDSKGNIYVSDSDTHKVHLLKDGKVSTYYETLTRPNGLLSIGTDLLILDSGSLIKLDANKKPTTLAEGLDKSTDGIMEVKPGEYIVSCWAGAIYYVKSDGSKELMLDTKAAGSNTADIGYDAKKKIVYVPTFLKNSVVAYQLK
ncbi:ATP/GTP-binding protein [Dyadobacter subterraneus]|uniref:ATP/GTP-binding protein n=1 Tax=Dyadobacter subterraneus TaxID=2773304 RepID=A0ABR9W6N8_9BACT|nr:ATP/GTP-binding protein [Dyadobacter subterraneus]MBE9460636.1 ATP/GTP-binding protein [Dyadobacter subterraneus]